MRTRALSVVVGGGVLVSAVLGAGAGAGVAADDATHVVTLEVQRFRDRRTELHQFFFSGTVSTPRAGEPVTVLYQRCGQSFSTAVASGTTDGRGVWGASPSIPMYGGSGTYRARWQQELSAPVRLRPAIGVQASRRSNRIRVSVTTYDILQDMHGRAVALQRLRSGRWSTVAHTRLRVAPVTDGFVTYAATFRYATHGAILRARVPTKSAAPCFRGATTARLRS